jgi:hypothetical protein
MEFAYEKQRSGADMQYRVRVTISTLSGTSYFGYPIYLALTMDGVSRVVTTLKNASPSQWSSAITYTSPWYTVANKTSGSTSVVFNVYSGSGSSRNKTYSYSMGVDPAASKLSASSGTLGTELSLVVTKYNTAFTHTIRYVCGGESGEVCNKVAATTVKWNASNGNSVVLSAQNTKGVSVNVTFTIETYSGSSLVGTNTHTIQMAIPGTVIPKINMTVTDATGYHRTFGAYIQGRSKLQIEVTPELAYGSPITSYSIQGDGKTYTDPSVTTDVIQGKGVITVTARVTDARGRTSPEASAPISVLEYAPPSVNVVAYRCNSSGTADSEGAYMRVGFTSSIASLANMNTATYTLTYSNGSTSKTLSGSGAAYTSDVIACDVSTVWMVEVKVSDKVGSTTKAAVIPIAFTLMDFYKTGKGIAFGKVATRDGFDCAMPAYFGGGVSIGDQAIDAFVTEYGTSGIWTYRKWSNGVAECWGTSAEVTANVQTAWGGVFAASNVIPNYNYPVAFTTLPSLQITYRATSYGAWYYVEDTGTNTRTPKVSLLRGSAMNNVKGCAHYYAIGRIS